MQESLHKKVYLWLWAANIRHFLYYEKTAKPPNPNGLWQLILSTGLLIHSPFTHPCFVTLTESLISVCLLALQCIDNIRCNGLMMNAFEENSKVTVPQMIKWESDTIHKCTYKFKYKLCTKAQAVLEAKKNNIFENILGVYIFKNVSISLLW